MVTASAFKLLYPGNGLKHLALFIGLLPDREALEAYVPKRRFLRGEGFIGWPGPAFLDFVEQVVAENRLRAGGLIIDHREVSLSDITCPVLYFYGRTDNLARPKAVKAIERAAPRAEAHGIEVDSGHFGLVVGSRSKERVWPLVADWVDWRDRGGQPPEAFRLNPPP